jgi:hypothetical protein
MHLKHILFISVSCFCAAFVGCGAEDLENRQQKVFKADASKQCENNGIALAEMRKELTSAGIDVICAQKGHTGMAYPAVCGSGTGNINIYLIHTNNLPDAEKLGFKSVRDLPEYKDTQCSE